MSVQPALKDIECRILRALLARQGADGGRLILTSDLERAIAGRRGWLATRAKRLRRWGWMEFTGNGYVRLTEPGIVVAVLVASPEHAGLERAARWHETEAARRDALDPEGLRHLRYSAQLRTLIVQEVAQSLRDERNSTESTQEAVHA